MSTRSRRDVKAVLEGSVAFDYAGVSRQYEILEAELQLLARRYGLTLKFELED